MSNELWVQTIYETAKKFKSNILWNESENSKNANGMSACLRMIYLIHFIFFIACFEKFPSKCSEDVSMNLRKCWYFWVFLLIAAKCGSVVRRLQIRNEEMCTLWFFCAPLYIFVIFLILVILWSRVFWLEAMISLVLQLFVETFFRVFWYWSFMCHKSMIRCCVEGGNLMSFCKGR